MENEQKNETALEHSTRENMGVGKKGSSKILWIVFGVLVLVLLVFGVYFIFFKTSSKEIYETSIQNLFSSVDGSLNKLEEKTAFLENADQSVLYEGSLNLSFDDNTMSALALYTYDYRIGLDYVDDKMELALTMREDEREVLSLALYVLDEMGYIESEDLFEGLLSAPVTNSGSFHQDIILDYTMIRSLLDKTEKALLNVLDENKMEAVKKNVTIKETSRDVTDHILTIDSDMLWNFVYGLSQDISNDADLVTRLANLLEVSEEDITAFLNSLQKEDFDFSVPIEVHLYTEGKDVVGFTVVEEDIEYIVGSVLEDNVEITFQDGTGASLITIQQTNSSISFLLSAEETTMSLSYDKEANTLVFDFDSPVDELAFTVEMNIQTETESDEVSHETITGNISSTSGEDTLALSFEVENTTTLNADIADINTSAARSMDSLTEDEMNAILENLQTILMNEENIMDFISQIIEDYATV